MLRGRETRARNTGGMSMFRGDELPDREGYYYHCGLRVILRLVRADGCAPEMPEHAGPQKGSDFRLLTPDVLCPLREVRRLAGQFGANAETPVINWQAARQPGGDCLIEESPLR